MKQFKPIVAAVLALATLTAALPAAARVIPDSTGIQALHGTSTEPPPPPPQKDERLPWTSYFKGETKCDDGQTTVNRMNSCATINADGSITMKGLKYNASTGSAFDTTRFISITNVILTGPIKDEPIIYKMPGAVCMGSYFSANPVYQNLTIFSQAVAPSNWSLDYTGLNPYCREGAY